MVKINTKQMQSKRKINIRQTKETKKTKEKTAKPRLSVGLALGGGGARGLAHVGVIKVLESAGIPIDFICGTSMGSLVGGWYAATKDILFLENLFSKIHNHDVFSKRKIIKNRGEVFKDKSIAELLDIGLGDKKIENCQIPFWAVATDINNGEKVILKKGNLENAIKASSAIPIFFKPVKFNKQLLTDGGLCDPVPADVVREMGADIVIAVDVSSRWVDFSEEEFKISHMPALIGKVASVAEYQIAKPILEKADIVLSPAVLSFNWHDFYKAKEIIFEGKAETKRNLSLIEQKTGYKAKEEEKPFFERFLNTISNG
ncbi:MAG: patatin-like phospholipase family protein [Candidatus Wolfebacteria bacterium]|nr:patatin-like phospholipase family protein [Candidatus Wolfebacteria bacterium]